AITTVKRATVGAEPAPAKTPPGSANVVPAVIARAVVELTFTASPSAMRKVLDQMASSEQQFFIVRTLYVRNEQLKGPSREQSAAAPPTSAIKFIVGNEHLETTATIEMVRFAF